MKKIMFEQEDTRCDVGAAKRGTRAGATAIAVAMGLTTVVSTAASCGDSLVASSGSGTTASGSGAGKGTGTTSTGAGSPTGSSSTSTSMQPPVASKVDVVMMIDNSSSMADKQRLLATAAPALLDRLTNPRCVGDGGTISQPTNPTDPCPSGLHREITPVIDLNIGIVDSSLGGMGSDECPDSPGYQNDDHGHLVARSASGNTTTYMNQGFLAWDPAATRGGITSQATLDQSIGDLILGVGQNGCGYEQQLESVLRFLVDPSPYQALTANGTETTPTGIDQALLTQRAAFLRPDSLVLVVLLSDENDFSLNFLNPQAHLPWNSAPFFRSSSECATNPNDACCYSCAMDAPAGCPARASDTSCSMNGGLYTDQQDGINLKPDQTKAKYGFEVSFPVARYVNGFSATSIDPTAPDLHGSSVANPLFAGGRDPRLVYFTAIVGLPYQAVAKAPNDYGEGLLDHDQLTAAGFWDGYVGDPDHYVVPTQEIMRESTAKRPGVGPGAPNGGDRSLDPNAPVDLQYACIFPLPSPSTGNNDCVSPTAPDDPICSPGGKEPQIEARTYPGLRELAVVHGLGEQGIAASMCTPNTTDPSKESFGYQPSVEAIVQQIKGPLGG